MSVCSELSLYLVIIFALTVLSQYPRCQDDQRINFTEQPTDVTVSCGSSHAATFPCKYSGTYEQPQWIINSQSYTTLELPPHHFYRNHTLIVENVKPQQNSTQYQCQVVLSNQGSPCALKSSVGRLIVKCKAFNVQYTSHYKLKRENPERLTGISTVVKTNTRFSGFNITYNITYSDLVSGASCESVKIPAFSCVDGICRHKFVVSSSLCSKTSNDISAAVGVTSIDPDLPDFFYTSDPIKIDAVNNFIDVSFDEISSRIYLDFINQPKEGDKEYFIRYGPLTQGCRDLSSQTDGRMSNSKSLSLDLELNLLENTSVCFKVSVNNGSKFVTVEGTYESAIQSLSSNIECSDVVGTVKIITITGIICVSVTILTIVMAALVYKRYKVFSKKLYIHDQNKDETKETDGYLLNEYNTVTSDDKNYVRIDNSTTFFDLNKVTNDCLMYEFAENLYPGYQPEDGYGYFKTTLDKLKATSRHKELILMAENIPRYVTFHSDIEEFISTQTEQCSDVYEQNRGFTKQLSKEDSFLYCARSRDITATAFWKPYDVTETCKQSEFATKYIPKYSSEWLRYCYFEFTKSEHIKPNQRVIVLKKDGTLFTGPGIRHLVGATGDGSKMTHVPKFPEDWKHVFIQSREVDRDLTKGTKYLFCAMMDRVRAHHSIYAIKRKCNMAEFARRQIPGFKPELGYGYYEFKEDGFFKPHKKVILVTEDNKLYTGGGAQFVCTGGPYTMHPILRKTKISPPNLKGTKWKHIFIQSHSGRRELLPGQKFLYNEYKTYR